MARNRDYPFVERCFHYFVTFTTVNWIEVFSQDVALTILINSVKFSQKNQGLRIHAFVIMSNHVHLIVSNKNHDNRQLHRALTSLRKFTGARLIEWIEREKPQLIQSLEKNSRQDRNRSFWQEGWHAEAIYSQDFFVQKVNYIHDNPRRAGLVEQAEEYPFSSARTLLDREIGVIEIDPL